ncbi:structure-specific endonuclease subunit SLX4-like [Actinia tenebrosa]|uniref:Structure-specific endonuclease subunit SLX4 n=1 Tax=Actinia tenebrosa TaxID=6105 RepID=A0A6P8H7N5_ACTTE|nr:structure-specific endonuclease subunit SLX4-like [Actinia tenebrosa]
MRAKLIEIYNYTHPGAAAQKQPQDNTSKTTKGPSLKQAKAPQRTAKPALKTLVSSSQPTRQPSKKKKNIPASQIRDSSDSDDDGYSSVRPASSQPSAPLKPSSYSTVKDPQGKFAGSIEDGSSSTSYSSQTGFPASRRLGNGRIESTSSLSEEDRGTGRGSGESNNEDEEEFGEASILIDKETDTASQQTTGDNLENKLLSFIESHRDVYLKVLTYRPIDLMALHELVKSSGIKCRLGQLIDFLDTQCITFTTAGQKPRQRRKPTRKKR